MGHLKILLMVVEHLRGLGRDAPRRGGGAIHGAVDLLAGEGLVLPRGPAALSVGLQLVLKGIESCDCHVITMLGHSHGKHWTG